MMLERLVEHVEARLLHLGRRLWPADPLAARQAELEWLEAQLREQRAELDRARAEHDETRRRLESNRNTAYRLPGQIKSSVARGQAEDAWRQALELDRLRAAIAEDRTALPPLGQVCWSLEFRIRQLERRLAALRRRPPPTRA